MSNDRGMVESPAVKRINQLCGDRYLHTVSRRLYLLISDIDGLCRLEGIDRRVVEVRREILDSPSSVWSKAT